MKKFTLTVRQGTKTQEIFMLVDFKEVGLGREAWMGFTASANKCNGPLFGKYSCLALPISKIQVHSFKYTSAKTSLEKSVVEGDGQILCSISKGSCANAHFYIDARDSCGHQRHVGMSLFFLFCFHSQQIIDSQMFSNNIFLMLSNK